MRRPEIKDVVEQVRHIKAMFRACYSELGEELSEEKLNDTVMTEVVHQRLVGYSDYFLAHGMNLPVAFSPSQDGVPSAPSPSWMDMGGDEDEDEDEIDDESEGSEA